MKMNNYLPIGSVIVIKGKKEQYLIIGKNAIHNKKSYDYVCVRYPYGFYEDCTFTYVNDDEILYLDFLGNVNE
jgi:hypothetical protein